MTDNLNSINSNEQNERKWWILERIRNSSRKVIAPVIAAGSISLWWLPSATIPTITWATAIGLLTACSDDEPDNPKDTVAPTVNVSHYDIDVSWWKQVRISWNQLYIWDVLVLTCTDNVTKNCKIELSLNWRTISSWTTINEWWYLTVKVSDEAGNTRTVDINLIVQNQLISWLENLRNLVMQVDQEVNLLNWITFWNWASLVKVEIEMDWQTTQITDPQHFVPAYPWNCSIILTVKWSDGKIVTEKVEKNIRALEYQSMEINNISPAEILPITWQVEVWDKNAYNHIEHTRIAEATRIRDMMWKYGAGSHSPAEYKQLMNRLHIGMSWEQPLWYDNYELIEERNSQPSNHAHQERNILNSLIDHANLQIRGTNSLDKMYNITQNNPNNIYIFWYSVPLEKDKTRYLSMWNYFEKRKKLCKSQNFILFVAWWNIGTSWWYLRNKIYHEDVTWDEHWVYWLPSTTNGKTNYNPNNHLIVSIWTNANGNIDQTNEIYESSKFPVWIHNNNLFAWRTFPAHSYNTWKIEAETWKYATSYVNYVNTGVAGLCFQMFAEVEDVNQLLNMIRSSSDLRDHIKFNWEDQPLILIDPSWFFKKYCMPTDLPTQINSWETVSLNKWYYKWVIFDIPWAEVQINWQWIAYNDANKSVIKSQNPMNLKWRINWELCRKMWYKWKTINWKIIAVDDNWNGLNIHNSLSINIQ